jgi:hypothetical protein
MRLIARCLWAGIGTQVLPPRLWSIQHVAPDGAGLLAGRAARPVPPANRTSSTARRHHKDQPATGP